MELHQEIYEVKAKTYSQKVSKVSDDCIYFQRTHHWTQDTLQIDAFAEFWSVALFNKDFPENCLYLHSGKSEIAIQPNQIVYIPAFSLVRWRIKPSTLNWNSFLVRSYGPFALNMDVRILPWNGSTFLNEYEAFNYVTQTHPLAKIQQEIYQKVVGLKFKKWIDRNYRKNLRLSEYTTLTDVSLPYLAKEFKLCFGLSPHSYLNKLRSFEGMFELMLKGEPIGGLSYSLGFKDSSTFYKTFSKEFLSKPNEFKLRG